MSEPDYYCFVCNKLLTDTFTSSVGNDYKTHDGTIFYSPGNYGSTEWDPGISGLELVIAICNDCFPARTHLALVERTDKVPDRVTYIEYGAYRGV